jgi:hypothetical protein
MSTIQLNHRNAPSDMECWFYRIHKQIMRFARIQPLQGLFFVATLQSLCLPLYVGAKHLYTIHVHVSMQPES